MATNIPPHNLGEIISGVHRADREPGHHARELMQIVPGPDFPTAGIINGAQEIVAAYKTGRGRLLVRARTHIEDVGKGDRQAIIVTELPYQVNKAKLIERIADLVRDKQIEGIASEAARRVRQGRHARGDRAQARRGAGDPAQQSVRADPDGDRSSASTWSRWSTASRGC